MKLKPSVTCGNSKSKKVWHDTSVLLIYVQIIRHTVTIFSATVYVRSELEPAGLEPTTLRLWRERAANYSIVASHNSQQLFYILKFSYFCQFNVYNNFCKGQWFTETIWRMKNLSSLESWKAFGCQGVPRVILAKEDFKGTAKFSSIQQL